MTSFDLTDTIVPRSDQLNAEDLLSGPRTVTVTEVRRGTAEQPVEIVTSEFGPGRPFKPSKTVRRILVAAWGKDAAGYVGRRMTLYRDPAVKFGGMDVGGIRVSHMSHIDKRLSLALTVTRGKRAPYVVEPLKDDAPTADKITQQQGQQLGALFTDAGITDKAARLDFCRDTLGRPVASSAELTHTEADQVLEALRALLDPPSGLDEFHPATTSNPVPPKDADLFAAGGDVA